MTARRWFAPLVAAVAVVALFAALVGWLNVRGDADAAGAESSVPVTPELVARGAYLARAGNCAGCHTARGGADYAGGRSIVTPFGTVVAGNLTPDVATGIGAWSPGDFWRALHNGRSKDGRLLYPAFPYPNTTLVTRADSDALHAWLRTLPAVVQARPAHALRFPFDRQIALAVWRALFFRPGVFTPDPQRDAAWNRGAYLVRGLGHCEACHAGRNVLGATSGEFELGGGPMPLQDWTAPSLVSAQEAGVAAWPADDVVALLQTGRSPHGAALGPMADVVFRSTQWLTLPDLQAMTAFLQSLPQSDAPLPTGPAPSPAALDRGAKLYDTHCADCHGAQGQGAAGAYPALAGNRKLTMASPANLVRVIVDGGFPAATQGNPRPYGMPPFGQTLGNQEIADIVTHLRNAWGHRAPAVSDLDVLRLR